MTDLARPPLRELCDDLQRQVAHSLVVEQELINARDRLDRDVTRFRAIEAYSRRAIRAESLLAFAETTVEAIIEAFEVECSAMLMLDGTGRRLRIEAAFGLAEGSREHCTLGMEWVAGRGLLGTGTALIERVFPGSPWSAVGLAHVILCPFNDGDGAFEGLLVGGVSAEKQAFYGELGAELIDSFVVFTEQVQSLLQNLRSRKLIREQIAALGATNLELEEKTATLQQARRQLEKRIAELSTLYTVGTAIVSILDMEQLLRAVLSTAVRDLGYDRAIILLVDEERNVLANGRGFGGTPSMDRFVESLQIPLVASEAGLARVVLSGEPLLVEDVTSASERLNAAIVRALETRSFLAVPLKAGDKVAGVMAVDNYRTSTVLTADDTRVLMTLASQVAIAIENARLLERVARSERLSAIGEMAAGLAHEIRNPLTSIGTLADLLEVRPDGRAVDPVLLQGIKEESRRLQEITTRFLNYARPYVPSRAPADINLILDEVTSLLALDERFAAVRIERCYDRAIGEVSMDGDAIKQVFWNLILNGLQAMAAGGTLCVRSAGLEDRVEVEVADTGPGIPRADLKRIFEPFYTTKDKGTGLGLPIADKIVRAHGGVLDVQVETGRGTRVRVLLPR